jgi:hypothetical protein
MGRRLRQLQPQPLAGQAHEEGLDLDPRLVLRKTGTGTP